MERSFNDAVQELIGKGVEPLEALEKAENSGEFSDEEIQSWYGNFNKYRDNR